MVLGVVAEQLSHGGGCSALTHWVVFRCGVLPLTFVLLSCSPYNIGRAHHRADSRSLYGDDYDDAMPRNDYIAAQVALAQRLSRLLTPGGTVLWNMGSSSNDRMLPQDTLVAMCNGSDLTLVGTIAWIKEASMPMQASPNQLSPLMEPVYVLAHKDQTRTFVMNKPQGKPNKRTKQASYGYVSNVVYARNNDECGFTAAFSVDLATQLLRLYARPGAAVCDPMMGIGTTGVACAMLGHDFIGVDLSRERCAVAQQRVLDEGADVAVSDHVRRSMVEQEKEHPQEE